MPAAIKVRRNINKDLKYIISLKKIEFDQYLSQYFLIKKAL